MSPELDERLCKRFPLLYADRHADMSGTCMCWGFECGDGWYEIIERLSSKLEKAIAALPAEERGEYRAVQVKEKYGTLRFYMTAETREMEKCIVDAERESAFTCEACGAAGKGRGMGWLYTACEEHVR